MDCSEGKSAIVTSPRNYSQLQRTDSIRMRNSLGLLIEDEENLFIHLIPIKPVNAKEGENMKQFSSIWMDWSEGRLSMEKEL